VRARPKALWVVVGLVAILLYYLVVASVRGVVLLEDHRWTVKILGVGVLLAPLVAIPLVLGELRFGRATERLAGLLDDDVEEREPLPRRPSGRVDRTAADALFERCKAEVRKDPSDWQRWFLLAEAYGEAGDTARGRKAMRTAIRLQAGVDAEA
jgi:cytochrome c-type biogenesis protein CcmH/NrfG